MTDDEWKEELSYTWDTDCEGPSCRTCTLSPISDDDGTRRCLRCDCVLEICLTEEEKAFADHEARTEYDPDQNERED